MAFVFSSLTDSVAQRDFLVAEEANFEIAVCQDTDSVARPAEVIGHAGDEAKTACVSAYRVVAGSIVGRVAGSFDGVRG